MKYEKLVRDRIPEIIANDGLVPRTRLVRGEALRAALHDKLVEEAAEFRAEPSSDELADVLEVVHALASAYGLDWAEVEAKRASKQAERGGFDGGVYLIESRPTR